MSFHVPEQYRLAAYSTKADGNNGMFLVKSLKIKDALRIIASDGEGWEHVSVSLPHRCPKWEEMCLVKNLFWDEEDTVVQFHPPKSQYVNCHPYCLHLWSPTDWSIRLPDSILVGPKAMAAHK